MLENVPHFWDAQKLLLELLDADESGGAPDREPSESLDLEANVTGDKSP